MSLKSNELNDFCIDSIKDIVSCCKNMKIFDISENLFLTSYKELVVIKCHSKISFKA